MADIDERVTNLLARLLETRQPLTITQIVGSLDGDVLMLNRRAAAMLRCPHQIEVVPGATHLFEEPGTLEAVAGHASRWFVRHLG